MKDYATETDIIETADPLFGPGDEVEHSAHQGGYTLMVDSFAWHPLKKSWTYVLLYYRHGNQLLRWDGSLAEEEAFEKDVKRVLRSRK